LAIILSVSFLILWSGCIIARPSKPLPTDTFGKRSENPSSDGRRTIDITPADSSKHYSYYPAVIDSVIIQPAAFQPGQSAVAVEALLKGAFPDGCMQLHDAEQDRSEHLIVVTLRMRRPQGALCASVMRPYRFYLRLDGVFEPGSYTLKINDIVHPFVVRGRPVDNKG